MDWLYCLVTSSNIYLVQLEKGLRPKRCSLKYYSASEQECAVALNLSLSRTQYRDQHLEKAIKNWCTLDFSTKRRC